MTKSVIFLISLSLLYHVHAQDAAQPAAEDCDPDWKSLSNGCYFTEVKKMNWQAAKDYCTEKKAKMVVVENKEIQAEIAAAFKELTDEPNKNRFWLDAKEVEKDGAKVWKVKEETEDATFKPWGTNAEAGPGDCIRSDGDLNWWRDDCTKDECCGGFTFNPLCVMPK